MGAAQLTMSALILAFGVAMLVMIAVAWLIERLVLGKLVNHVLEPDEHPRPNGPYAAAVKEWEELERFVESRLRRE